MEIKILFLGVLKYQDKETKEDRVRISYIVNDESAKQNTKSFKGVQECAYYCNDGSVFDKLTTDEALTPMTLIVEQRPSLKNPLKTVSVLKGIKTKNAIIDILQ